MKKLLTFLLLLGSVTCFAQKIALALNLTRDSTYYLTSSASLSIVQDFGTQQQIINTTINARVAHKVIAVKDSIYEMEVQYKNLGMRVEAGGKVVDISAQGEGMTKKMINAMLNKPFRMTITKTGKVLTVSNTDVLYAHMFDGALNVSEAQKAQFLTQMKQSFGDNAFKKNFQEAFAMLPGAKVGLNDKWEANSSIESMTSVKMKTTYTVAGITDKAVVLHGQAVVSPGSDTAFKLLNGLMTRYIKLSGSAVVELKIDKKTGWIISSKTSKNIKGTVEIKDSPKTPGGLIFLMSVKGNMVTTGE